MVELIVGGCCGAVDAVGGGGGAVDAVGGGGGGSGGGKDGVCQQLTVDMIVSS